jgi:hypothetical protein
MLAALLVLSLAGPPVPELASETTQPPPPQMVEPPRPQRRVHRCLPGVEPCVRPTSIRLMLGGIAGLTVATSMTLSLVLGDRSRIGDPVLPLGAGGLVALSAAAIGGVAALLRGDGPTLPDRITPATIGLTLGFTGTSIRDERAPLTMLASFAPTFALPNKLGRIRVLGNVGGKLGEQLERDVRPQTSERDGSFATAMTVRALRFDVGLDVAMRLPYPLVRRHPAGLGQVELRYKPNFWYWSDSLLLGEAERVSQRVMLTPLNFGVRWHLSPRQRFTVYLGPRWDMYGYGEPGRLAPGKPVLGPIYSESWFDLDVPISSAGRRAGVVGQLTLGYVHARTLGNGLDFGPVVGFFGQVRTQFALRVRPRGSAVAYQFEAGAQIGASVAPYLRVGVVLPDIGGRK